MKKVFNTRKIKKDDKQWMILDANGPNIIQMIDLPSHQVHAWIQLFA
jgi:hypothetical protein